MAKAPDSLADESPGTTGRSELKDELRSYGVVQNKLYRKSENIERITY